MIAACDCGVIRFRRPISSFSPQGLIPTSGKACAPALQSELSTDRTASPVRFFIHEDSNMT
ncbi:hypothetical protein D3C73_1606520 [compost metagenome]